MDICTITKSWCTDFMVWNSNKDMRISKEDERGETKDGYILTKWLAQLLVEWKILKQLCEPRLYLQQCW